MDATASLDAYRQAWEQSDESQAEACLESCWTARSTYLSPITDLVTGVAAFARLIADYHVMFPGATVQPSGDVMLHHDHLCYPWRRSSRTRMRVLGQDYGKVMDGLDIIQFSDHGEFLSVVAFFCGPSGCTHQGPDEEQRSEWLVSAGGPRLARL